MSYVSEYVKSTGSTNESYVPSKLKKESNETLISLGSATTKTKLGQSASVDVISVYEKDIMF